MHRQYLSSGEEPPPPTEEAFEQLPLEVRIALLSTGLQALVHNWAPQTLPVVAMTQALLASTRSAATLTLRADYAAYLLWAGNVDAANLHEVLQPLRDESIGDPNLAATADAIDAAALALQGRWSDAEAAYDAAFAAMRRASHRRKTELPELLTLPYVLALLAQQTRVHWNKAMAFCQTESGKRKGSMASPYECMTLAVQSRSGEVDKTTAHFRLYGDDRRVYRLDLWLLLMRAWLASDPPAITLSEGERAAVERMHSTFVDLGLNALAAQVVGARAVLSGEQPPLGFFVATSDEGWRDALAALARLGEPDADIAAAPRPARVLWVIRLNEDGSVDAIAPFEQRQGPRGWGKPTSLPLNRLERPGTLTAADAAVAKALRPGHGGRDTGLSLAVAIGGLVGHPAIEFEDAPGVAAELIESQPELDVVDAGSSLVVRLTPPLRPPVRSMWPRTAAQQEEEEALRLITVVRDTPQRARLVRFNPAQVRAALLIGEQLVVPKQAVSELQRVLRGLGMHFQVHVDGLDEAAHSNARVVPAEARLRAELAPLNEGVSIRLVVAPMGLQGPRLTPGHGRAHMIATVRGETLCVERDLNLEREHLDSVIDACPMLAADSAIATVSADWMIEGADDALELLERLPSLPAIAGIDWPKGQPVHVDAVTLSQLHVRLHSGREWLELQGGISFDEQMVVSLQKLLQWTVQDKSRFVPIGAGRYLALTSELRSRLQDLASVSHFDVRSGDMQVPHAATSWLQSTLEGSTLGTDDAFRNRLQMLADAQYTAAVLPLNLQATFRPYQEEGYAWAMRLAQAGFGAVLADDMGLGKTLQALAVLLARASGGPALVVAPTSLSGNWSAEARRFAPTLALSVFGETERDSLIERAGPGDVVVVSYQLLQLNLAAFTARRWHTLVVDEAQAIKNASAKRSQAAFELQADFRLALSGTPIENRLAELWSIMRLCNAGLLGTLKQFNDRFANPIERDGNRLAQRTLRRLIAPFVLRRTKAEVLDDLPPRTEVSLMVEPDVQERAHYEALRREALTAVERAIASDKPNEQHMNVLAQLTRLRRAACDPRLVTPQLSWVGAKVQAFGELAAELVANGHKALVFSQFVDFLTLLREPLDAAGIPYQYLDGSTSASERTRRVAAFQGGTGEMFLISLKAGGFGLNLTLADYVVIADPWWNPAAEDQASGRAHRIGQLRPVTVYRLVNKGTLEERIVALHQRKRELAESVLDGGAGTTLLRADELVELIRGGNAEFDEEVPGWTSNEPRDE